MKTDKDNSCNIIAVVGSRGFNDYPFFARKIKEITKDLENYSFISGGAKSGADNLIVKYCKENRYNLLEILPNWALYGKSAGVIRNSEIVNSATHLIAFWDGKSKGTKDSIRRAEIKGIPTRVINTEIEKYPQQHEFVKEYIELCEKYDLQINGTDILHISRFKNNYINLTDFIGGGLEGEIVYEYNNTMTNDEQLKFIKNILYGK